MEYPKIIREARAFNEKLNNYLTNIPEGLISDYYSSLEGISAKIHNEFQCLKYVSLPTMKPKTSFIYGDLIPNNEIKRFGKMEVAESNLALPIFAIIPVNYTIIGINVYDCKKRIIWENIPNEYCHCRDKNDGWICTHNPKKDIMGENCIIDILYMAWNLFQEYKRFDRTGKFELDCHPHR